MIPNCKPNFLFTKEELNLLQNFYNQTAFNFFGEEKFIPIAHLSAISSVRDYLKDLEIRLRKLRIKCDMQKDALKTLNKWKRLILLREVERSKADFKSFQTWGVYCRNRLNPEKTDQLDLF